VLGIGNLGRRLVEGAVGLFALLGFLYVPLGRHTGWEHTRAVLSTPAASAAIDDVTAAVLSLRQRASDFITGRLSRSAATPEPRSTDHGKDEDVRPVPPKLK
jgi:hypothetical protein